MSNRYEIKVFNINQEYKTTINPNKMMNDVSISGNVNGGLGQLSLNIANGFGDTTFSCGDYIKVILYNERHKDGKQIYFGFVSQIQRIMETNREYIQLKVLGIASLLKSVIFNGTGEQTITGTAGTIINSVLAVFNEKYSNIIQVGSIDTTGETLTLELTEGTTCWNVISNINDVKNYFWYIDGEGKIRFRAKGSQQNHILVVGKSVEAINITTSLEEICNTLYLKRSDGTIKTYTDTTSISSYGMKGKYTSNTELADETTQDEYGNNYIEENDDVKDATTITVNDSYEIESIVPGDKITVLNIEYGVKDLIVEKIKLSPTKIVLTIEENETLRDIISK